MSSRSITILKREELPTTVANGVTLVDFGAPWCQPCRQQQVILEKVSNAIGDRVRICTVDVDENVELAREYQIHGIPTLLLFKNGVTVKRFVGVQAVDDLMNAFEEIDIDNHT